MGKLSRLYQLFGKIIQLTRTMIQIYKKRIIVSTVMLSYVIAIFMIGSSYIERNTYTIYEVFVEGKKIGTVKDKQIVESWTLEKTNNLIEQYPDVQMVIDKDHISYRVKEVYKGNYDHPAILAALDRELAPRTIGVEVKVNGNVVGIVNRQETADEVLNQIKNKYINPGKTNDKVTVLSANAEGEDQSHEKATLESADFVQQVNMASVYIKPSEIMDADELLRLLETGDVQPIIYKVQQGDCVSCIADKFNISQDQIYENNDWIENDFLNIGDELDLTVLQPVLSVKTIEKKIEIVEVPAGAVYEEDDSMRLGTSKTLVQGKPGQKEIVYQITRINGMLQNEEAIDENMLIQPITAVIKQGTKVIPGIGTGTFAWPVNDATLTSKFGKRWGRLHAGTDSVSDDRSILASDNGKVIYSGWKSGYGNCVIIDHQNGYKTLYAHMKKLNTKKGSIVEKGENIGVMGTTGNSTGVHLHFEILKEDKQENPLKFLNK